MLLTQIIMKFSNLKKAFDYEIKEWLIKSLELTPYQQSKMYEHEIIRFSPFEFYKLKKKTVNPLIRLTIIVYPIAWLALLLFLPINYFISGRWGYSKIQWFTKWSHMLNL